MIIVIVMMFCMVLVAVGAYLFLNRPQEGDECKVETPDDNALTYEIDDEGECVLKSCKSGYYKSGKECLVEEEVYIPPTPVLRDTPETMRSASTVWSGQAIGVGHGRGRLDSVQGWSAQNNTVGEWYQLDNGVVGKITGVAIKGRATAGQWVTGFKVKSKGATGTWTDVDGGKVYTGNTDMTTQVDVTFDTPVDARYIRIYPQTWNGHMSLRADIVAGETRTNKTPTVVDVPYSGHKSSGNWGGDAIGTSHGAGRLDSNRAWSADANAVGKWYELDNGSATDISGVVIKGRPLHSQYVTSFKAQYKDSTGAWKDVDGGYIFEGSQAADSQANVFFKEPVNTTAIRIYPQTWNNHMSMRAGLMTGGSSTTEGYQIGPMVKEIQGFSFY
ncbi:discoidin domain-containing protein [Akkermansiaceae bacterium]|nr:discoidin domain-containing protein [Akkermansiaceae bacterium]